MAQERVNTSAAERRCPNCGTRVARDAESCFMCGSDLRRESKRRRQISWLDALLVLAVLMVLVFWWQAGSRQANQVQVTPTVAAGIPNEQIPFVPFTPTPTPPPANATPEAVPTQGPTGTVEHTVEANETLLSIAIDFNVTVEDIRAANGISGDIIQIGQVLTIPNQQAVVAPPASAPESPRGQVSTFDYTVQEGDTIATIAARLGSSVDDILRANSISDPQLIRPDQTLQIPMRQVPAEVMQSSGTGTDGSIAYGAPQITAPATGAVISRSEPVLLRWVSVDLLEPNEWYVVLLYPQTPAARQFPSVWTKATSHRIELEYTPDEGQSAEYAWQVSVVRVLDGEGGAYSLEPASPSSELRRFIWQ